LTLLQRKQHATKFSHESFPPRERGSTWSIVFAGAPQYPQRLESRRKTPRRETGKRRDEGMRT